MEITVENINDSQGLASDWESANRVLDRMITTKRFKHLWDLRDYFKECCDESSNECRQVIEGYISLTLEDALRGRLWNYSNLAYLTELDGFNVTVSI